MDISKYKETGNKIKTLSLKLQMLADPEVEDTQGQITKTLEKYGSKTVKNPVNPTIAVVGLLFVLIVGTFVLLHFW